MQLSIRHETRYSYSTPLSYSIQMLRLAPRDEPQQRVRRWQIQTPGERHDFLDAFGNRNQMITLGGPHQEICLIASGEVEVAPLINGRLPAKETLSPLVFTTSNRLTQQTPAIAEFAHRHLPLSRRNLPAAYLQLADAIRAAVAYESGITVVTTTAADALRAERGVCQDHAHLFIACCQVHGIAARYVSGYIDPGDTPHAESHAWVDVWIDDGIDAGWVSIDVTHARYASDAHCRLAVGRDYESAAPVRGVRRGGGMESLWVRVDVQVLA